MIELSLFPPFDKQNAFKYCIGKLVSGAYVAVANEVTRQYITDHFTDSDPVHAQSGNLVIEPNGCLSFKVCDNYVSSTAITPVQSYPYNLCGYDTVSITGETSWRCTETQGLLIQLVSSPNYANYTSGHLTLQASISCSFDAINVSGTAFDQYVRIINRGGRPFTLFTTKLISNQMAITGTDYGCLVRPDVGSSVSPLIENMRMGQTTFYQPHYAANTTNINFDSTSDYLQIPQYAWNAVTFSVKYKLKNKTGNEITILDVSPSGTYGSSNSFYIANNTIPGLESSERLSISLSELKDFCGNGYIYLVQETTQFSDGTSASHYSSIPGTPLVPIPTAPPLRVKINGSQKSVAEVYTKINNTWKKAKLFYTNINNTWKKC